MAAPDRVAPEGGSSGQASLWSLTLGRLGLHEGLDEQVGGLRIEG